MTQLTINKTISSWFLISFFLFIGNTSSGQGLLGLSQSNYSALTGGLTNPAFLTITKNYAEVNVLTFNFFAYNDFAYVPGADVNIYQLMRKDPELPEYGDKKSNFLYYRNRDVKNMDMNVNFLGPSVMYQHGKHGFALTTSFRYLTSANRIPWELPVIGYEGIKYKPIQNVNYINKDIDVSTQAWMEIGFSYAYDIYHSFDHQITVGASVKLMWAYTGVTAQVSELDYIITNDSTINFKNLNGQIGYAVPVNYQTNDFPYHDPLFKGFGVGLDLGVVYTKRRYIDDKDFTKACDQRFEDYIYRIGFSILDIGATNYKNNAQYHSFDDVSVIWQNFDTISFSNVNQVVQELSDVFYGDPDASYRTDNFKIGSPLAVSLQFDYRIPKKEVWYIAATWIQPVRFNLHTLRRPAQLAIIPRYETKNIEVSVPLSLYQYQHLRIGLSARFGFFSLGTEKLGTYLGLGDINGIDFYASVRFNFGKGSCKVKIPDACSNSEFGYSDKEKAMFRK